jgi:phosphinothricin acetyltransferase
VNSDITIRQARTSDAEAIAAIYNGYVETTVISFETEPVPVTEMAQRIQDRLARYDWLVAEREGQLIGYAYYGQFRTRAAYDHVVESTVYVAEDAVRLGVGRRLYADMIASAQAKGFREIIGVIALPNDASEQLHARMGFTLVGRLPKVGYKFGRYIDVSFWQWSAPEDSPCAGQPLSKPSEETN